jgi:PTS system nitrogen regulatory IIA component
MEPRLLGIGCQSASTPEEQLDIKAFLAPTNVIIDVRASDRDQLLRELSQRAAAALGLDEELVTAEILKREELGSTGMGDGMAIPHARIRNLFTPFGVLARLRRGIDFAAIDEKPVDIVFLLLLPGSSEGEQLNVLASVARKLRDPEIASAIRSARDGAEVYATITAN